MKKDFRDHVPKAVQSRALGGKLAPKTWEKQERRLARTTGGNRQPRSGAGPVLKGDIDAGRLLIEAKATDAASLLVKRAWLEKVTVEAVALGKTPALAITFADVPLGMTRDWILVPKDFIFDGAGE